MKSSMKLVKMKVADLLPADYNPRKDLQPGDPSYEKLKRSVMEFGYVDPLVVNKRTGRVVGGHQRLKILQDLGYEEVEVSVVDVSEAREKILNVALNKIEGEWDFLKLKDLFSSVEGLDVPLDVSGFDLKEIDAMVSGISVVEPQDGDFTSSGEGGLAVNVKPEDEAQMEEITNFLDGIGAKYTVKK